MTNKNEMHAINIHRKDLSLDESFNNPYQDEKIDTTICLKSYNFDHHITA